MEGIQQPIIHPRIFPWAPQAPLDPVMATLTRVTHRTVVSITGGCAKAAMAYGDGSHVLELFTMAFTGFTGMLLIGGSRMVSYSDPSQVLFGITEVGPAIRKLCPQAYVLGVIPRLQEVVFYQQASMLKIVHTIGEPSSPNHTTIVHPEQDLVVGVTGPLRPQKPMWYDEIEFRRYLTENLCQYGGWDSLLIAYNGGDVTKQEIVETAQRGRPVLLIKGSGRVTDELANDAAFLRAHPTVTVCQHTAASLRQALIALRALPPSAKQQCLQIVS